MRTLSGILMVAGSAWYVLAAVGVARLGDTLARVHAATKATTLGMILVVGGAVAGSPGVDAIKLSLTIGLVALTAPVGGHLLGRAVEENPGTAELRIDVRATLEQAPPDGDARPPRG